MHNNFCIIDIGTNAVKCKIFSDGQYFTLRNKYLTSSGYDNLKEDEILNYLQEFAAEAKTKNVEMDKVYICATEGFRTSANQREIRELVFEKMGRKIHIISKQREALLSFLGAMVEIPKEKRPTQNVLYIESGGGSTEMSLVDISCRPLKMIATVSMPLGSKRVHTAENNEDFKMAVKDFLNQIESKNFVIDKPLACVINSTSAARIIAAQYHPQYFDAKTTMLKQARMSMLRFRAALNNIAHNNFHTEEYWLKERDYEGFKNHCYIFRSLFFELQNQKFPLSNVSVTTSVGGVKDGACYMAERVHPSEIEKKVFGRE